MGHITHASSRHQNANSAAASIRKLEPNLFLARLDQCWSKINKQNIKPKRINVPCKNTNASKCGPAQFIAAVPSRVDNNLDWANV